MDITIGTNLTEITTNNQLKNGTRMFHCSRTNALYGSYSSGYVRREVQYTSPRFKMTSEGLVKAGDYNNRMQYPLNKRTKSAVEYEQNGCRTSVMIMDEDERLNLIVKASQNYKGYNRS